MRFVGGRRWLMFRKQRELLFSLAAMVIADQVVEHSFEKIAKPPTRSIGPAQVATDKAQRKLLRKLVRRVGIAQRPEKVAVDDFAIAREQLLLRRSDHLSALVAVGPAHDRPQGLDLAEPLRQARL